MVKDLQFFVTKGVLDWGVKIVTARISGVRNRKTTPEIDAYVSSELEDIKQKWVGKNWKEDKILEGFRTLHTKVGRSNRDYPASPEVLLKALLEKARFPRINAVVDLYNLISLKTQLALGAHNIDRVNGNITLRFTNGKENFLPLGHAEKVPVFPGEYAYCDDGNTIICRLEVLQVEPTKITEEANDIFFIIQGNENTTPEYVKNAATQLGHVITNFLGGDFSLLENNII